MSLALADISAVEPSLGCDEDLLQHLVAQGVMTSEQAEHAKNLLDHCDTTLDEIVIGEHFATQQDVLEARSCLWDYPIIHPSDLNQALPEFKNTPPHDLIRHAIFPCWISYDTQALIVSDPQHISDELRATTDELPIFLAHKRDIQNAIAKHARKHLLARAQTRVLASESGRKSEGRTTVLTVLSVAALIIAVLYSGLYPIQSMTYLTICAVVVLIIGTACKAGAFFTNLRQGPESTDHELIVGPAPPLPKISMLVPMFKEPEIVQILISRMRQLTYPKALLEVVLVLEEKDQLTQNRIAEVTLPHWIRVIIVPEGGLKTKPHAMNYALDFCAGDIIGIYDAEDFPEPEQLTRVARKFQSVPQNVACLQGILDFYNAKHNWLSRCFTIEYATWFRMILPGMRRLGFCIPLGGTTLFVRRAALEHVGAWDAHNVTEDADLGFRLERYGYHTEMVDIVTEEEANCQLWPWIKQRSRWLKGYLMTYLVHMRRPLRLIRQLGFWRFVGFQAHFLSAIFQFLLAPVLWSFWLVIFDLPHPLSGVWSELTFLILGSLFLSIEVLNIAMYITSVSNPKHAHLMKYAPLMHFYWPIGLMAGLKSVYEFVFKPYFWDKTRHGQSFAPSEDTSEDPAEEAAKEAAKEVAEQPPTPPVPLYPRQS